MVADDTQATREQILKARINEYLIDGENHQEAFNKAVYCMANCVAANMVGTDDSDKWMEKVDELIKGLKLNVESR